MGSVPMTNASALYACVYAKEFPAQALLRLRPELHSKPCVVLQGDPPLQQVCSLNARARVLGMSHGMTRVEVETFPQLIILMRSGSAEQAARAVLLECVGGFSPRIEDRSEDTAFLCGIDIAGTEKLFGPCEELGRALLQGVQAIGSKARITVSCNLHAAVCLAKGQSQRSVKVIAPGDEASVLAPLPLSVLNPTEAQAQMFSLWGIHTLGMLAALPEHGLIARMGQDGKRLQQLAKGELPHLFQPVELAFTLEEQIQLDSPVELLDSLLFVIGVMLDQLIVRAKARIVALASVTIRLVLDGGGTHARRVRPALPSNDKLFWIKLLHLDLEAHPPPSAILAVALTAEPGSTSKVQLGLFTPQLPEPARLDVTLARIRAIVGEHNVGRAVLQDTHKSESFCVEPFAVAKSGSVAGVISQPRVALRQLRPPETTSVSVQNQQPTRFYFRSLRYAVERAYGPWLVSGEWWSQALWGSEQWDVIARAHDGSMLCGCLVRDLTQNLWQMAALYD
jgi:protein ImuB